MLERFRVTFECFPEDDNAAKAASLGLMDVIKAAMEQHASSEHVSKSGLGALTMICVNGACADFNEL